MSAMTSELWFRTIRVRYSGVSGEPPTLSVVILQNLLNNILALQFLRVCDGSYLDDALSCRTVFVGDLVLFG